MRPADLRLADPGSPGVDVRVTAIQRTGPVVRATAETITDSVPLNVEFPHLHHDVPRLAIGAVVRLCLMQFSVYPRGERAPTHNTVTAPVLIGRERERQRDEATIA